MGLNKDDLLPFRCNRSAFLFHEMLQSGIRFQDTRKFYAKNTPIFEKGRTPNGLYCIINGKVNIHKSNENGKEVTIRLAGPTDVIGYRSLLADSPYAATAMTMENTVCGFVPKRLFFELLQKKPEIGLKVMKLLSEDLAESQHLINSLAVKNVKQRVAQALLLYKETYDLSTGNNQALLQIKREELAKLAGTATENAIRALSSFQKSGIIKREKTKIRILDLKALLLEADLED